MPDFALDYSVLHEARKDLHDLADRIAPTLGGSDFANLGKGDFGDAQAIFGHAGLTNAFRSLYRLSKDPMENAVDRLKRLGDLFGSVSDAYFDVDAQIADGLGVMGAQLGLDEWRKDKAAWDYRNEHADKCVPDANGDMPDFCRATDPGAPPVDQVINTPNGQVHTHLTLDENNNVVKEETTVTHDDQSYSSVTTYSDGGRSYRTETTFSDGGRTVADTRITNDDGGGTMTVTDQDGKKTEYTRDNRSEEWKQVGGEGDGDGDGVPDDAVPPPPPPRGTTGPPPRNV
ncbi:hypothetical protein [Nonomuraea aridisoli]|uniref:hypothetical protein n=1 Tax=Nonomuraea aridisoli TaxID=2070368 RepID=UPI0011B936AA|nr:hypothetical protein [Nonomuraea aridisoli]